MNLIYHFGENLLRVPEWVTTGVHGRLHPFVSIIIIKFLKYLFIISERDRLRNPRQTVLAKHEFYSPGTSSIGSPELRHVPNIRITTKPEKYDPL